MSIAGLSPDALAERLAPYVSRDNEMTVRDRVPFLMASPNVLRALGLATADGTAPITVQAGGKTVTASLDVSQPAGELRSMRDPSAPVPLWERHPDKAFWYDYDPAAKLLYVGYNEVTDTPQQTGRSTGSATKSWPRGARPTRSRCSAPTWPRIRSRGMRSTAWARRCSRPGSCRTA